MRALGRVLLRSVLSSIAILAFSSVGIAGVINSNLDVNGERCTYPPIDCVTIKGFAAASPWQGRVAFSTKSEIEMMSDRELVEAFQAEYIVALDLLLAREEFGFTNADIQKSDPGVTVRGQSIGF
jgi:hypothetical protein